MYAPTKLRWRVGEGRRNGACVVVVGGAGELLRGVAMSIWLTQLDSWGSVGSSLGRHSQRHWSLNGRAKPSGYLLNITILVFLFFTRKYELYGSLNTV